MSTTIVVIDDDPQVRSLVGKELEFEGFTVVLVDGARPGLEAIRRETPGLVLLDLGLPDRSGFQLLTTLRDEGIDVPVVVISGREREADKVRALTLGADDYMTKPFGFSELIARVHAVLRRRRPSATSETLAVAGIALDVRRREVRVGGRRVELTAKEFDILRLLLQRPGEVVSRDEILDAAWRDVYVGRRAVDTHISELRRKVAAEGGPAIVGVRGVGYRLVDDESP